MEINEILTKLKKELIKAQKQELEAYKAYEDTPVSNIPEKAVSFAEYSDAHGYHKGIMDATNIILEGLGEMEV